MPRQNHLLSVVNRYKSRSRSVASFQIRSESTFTKWLNKASNIFKVIATPDDANPLRVQEKNDIYLLLHSLKIRERLAKDPTSTIIDQFEPATVDLKKQGVLKLSNYKLRGHLQNEINPDIVDILLCFEKVVDEIPHEVGHLHEEEILKEHEYTATRLLSAPSDSPQKDFLKRKLGALETLMSFYGWTDNPTQPDWELYAHSTDEHKKRDDFGYDGSSSDPQILSGMRDYQTINMCRSVRIRQQLGYSSITLKSTIRGVGRGVFVDGECTVGRLLAFVPGEVWPKEHLEKLASDTQLMEHFSHNQNYQLFGRGDGLLVDARRSPYTVLDHDFSNPWAIGHIANHPPKGGEINCRKVPINFVERDFKEIMHFVPNTFARKPDLLGQGALQMEIVAMYGLGLMSRLNICDQEIFYNYRLNPVAGRDYKGPPIPEWFHEEFKSLEEPEQPEETQQMKEL